MLNWRDPVVTRIQTIPKRVGAALLHRAEALELQCRQDMLALFDRNPAARLLDVGSADGAITGMFAHRIGTRDVTAMDIVPENIAACEARGYTGVTADITRPFPFPDNTFDVVTASHCIEHVADTDALLREIQRVLRPGGYTVIATPNLAAWHHIGFLLLGFQPTIAEVSDEVLVGTLSPRGSDVGRLGPAHRRIFTPGALKGLCEHHGLRVDRWIGSGFFPFSGNAARRLAALDRRHPTNICLRATKR